MYLNIYHKPYRHSITYMHLTKNAQRTTDNNIVQTRVGDRAGWPAAKHPYSDITRITVLVVIKNM